MDIQQNKRQTEVLLAYLRPYHETPGPGPGKEQLWKQEGFVRNAGNGSPGMRLCVRTAVNS